MTIKIHDIVRIKERREVEPLMFIDEGTVGEVIDVTCPDYARVKVGYKTFWIDMKYLDRINN